MTQKKVKHYLKYNKRSGLLTWRNPVAARLKVGDIAGSKQDNGYITVMVENKVYKAHRLIWLYVHGEFPEDYIDHINHVRDDNRFSNLRSVSRVENGMNQSLSSANKSGVIGVGWKKKNNKWYASITVEQKQIHLGLFVEFHEAVNARKNAEVLYGFHENHGKEKI